MLDSSLEEWKAKEKEAKTRAEQAMAEWQIAEAVVKELEKLNGQPSVIPFEPEQEDHSQDLPILERPLHGRYSRDEVAHLLGASPSAVTQWCRMGIFGKAAVQKPNQIKARWLFGKKEVDQLLGKWRGEGKDPVQATTWMRNHPLYKKKPR